MSAHLPVNPDLILALSSRIFPAVVRDRLQNRCLVTADDARDFFSVALDKNPQIQPEVVVGCVLSALSKIPLPPKTSPLEIPWVQIKPSLISEIVSLRRKESFWNAYYRLFYELITAYYSLWFTNLIIERFCSYLRFGGSIHFDNDDFTQYLSGIGLSHDEAGITAFISSDDTEGMLPAAYQKQLVRQTTYRIYDLTNNLAENGERGGPGELLLIIDRLRVFMDHLPPSVGFEELMNHYPQANTSTDPIQRLYDATVAGLLQDIALNRIPELTTSNAA